MAADRLLQQEINQALEDLADSLPLVVDLRLARVLAGVLEPSWSEHVSFQDHALFPIIARRHDAGNTTAMLDRFKAEHGEIGDRHVEVGEHIETLLEGGVFNADTLGYLLRSVFECRRRHMEAESGLDALLPRLLAPADLAVLAAWNADRPQPPFPINLVLGSRG